MESPYNPIDDSIEEPASHEQIKELKDVENVNSHAEQLSNLLQNYVRTYKVKRGWNRIPSFVTIFIV